MIYFIGELWEDNHLKQHTSCTIDLPDTRTHQILKGLEEICYSFDLGIPIWLDSNVREFQRHNQTRFTKDNFVESIDFDYLKFQILKEEAF